MKFFSKLLSFSFLSMNDNWEKYPNKIYSLYPRYLNHKYISTIKYNNENKILGIGTNNGYTSLYKINDFSSVFCNKVFDKSDVNNLKFTNEYILSSSDIEGSVVNDYGNNVLLKKKWSDSTLYELIDHNRYYRFNYFGECTVYNLKKNTESIIKFDIEYYILTIKFYDNKFFIITSDNVLHILDKKLNLEFKYKIDIPNLIFARTILVKRIVNIYYLIIGYHSGDILNINFLLAQNNLTDNKINYQYKNNLVVKHNSSIRNIIINFNLLFILDNDDYINCYKLSEFPDPLKFLYKIKLKDSYNYDIEYNSNYIFLNEKNSIRIFDYTNNKNQINNIIQNNDDGDNGNGNPYIKKILI